MRKLIVILLLAVFCANLVACGEQATEDTHLEQEVVAAKIETVENSSVLVLFSVNPSFEIYAGDNGIIQSVKAANEDAEKVLNGKDYSSVSVKVCVTELLDIMYQNGYLKDGSQLSINTYVHEDRFPSFDYQPEIEDILVSYTNANQITLTYSNTLDVIPAQCADNTGQSSSTGTDPNAPSVIQQYNADGTMTEIHNCPNGEYTERHFSKELILLWSVEYYQDGNKVETWYDENGRVTESKHSNEKGELTYHNSIVYRTDGYTNYLYDVATGAVTVEQEYSLDGREIKGTVYLLDGKHEVYYSTTGEIEREVLYMADGSWNESIYSETGYVENAYTAAGVKTATHEFDLNHVAIHSYGYDWDTGELIEEKTFENGVLTRRWYKEYNAEGVDTYANGVLAQRQISWDRGDFETIICDSEGNYSQSTITSPDGSYKISYYALDGDGEYVCGEAYYSSAGVLEEQYTYASRAEWVNAYLPGGPV